LEAGNQHRALLKITEQLSAALGRAGRETLSEPRSPLGGDGERIWGMLSDEDEELVGRMRQSLASVAAAAGAENPGGVDEKAVRIALDGAELVIRGELASGNSVRLPGLMAGFVFLVTLPVVDQDRAIELSRRAAEIAEEEDSG
jgi:hypothetical protein